MKTARRRNAPRSASSREVAALRARLAESSETLRAICAGEVDAVMVEGKEGPRVFTLEGEENAYRALIESMNEGALTISADGVILYANQCFARMVRRRLEQVIGASFHTFLSPGDQAELRSLLPQAGESGAKANWMLRADDGPPVPAQISIRGLARKSFPSVSFALVVTDMTEARHNEVMLRDLAHRLVQAQEVERGRVANELRVNITQLLYVLQGRCEALTEKIPAGLGPASGDTAKIGELLRKTAEEVERIWRSLWSYELEKLGLVPALEKASAEFMERTGVSVQMESSPLAERLPAEVELVLYRILQKALNNVERHARARHVTVHLTRPGAFVQLTIQDDGIGFSADQRLAKRNGEGGFGLLRMRERAASVGGILNVKSTPQAGTEIAVRIPLGPTPRA